MSYQFYNNWPYSATIFPSMIEHTDPVNNEYFGGLHEEVQTIEQFIGLQPQGADGTVRARLDRIDYELDNLPVPSTPSLENVRAVNNQISGNIDFNKKQATGLVFDNQASAPASPVNGQVYYNTAGGGFKFFQYNYFYSLGLNTLEAIRLNNNKIQGTIDFNKQLASGFHVDVLAAAPTSPATGQLFWDTLTYGLWVKASGWWKKLSDPFSVTILAKDVIFPTTNPASLVKLDLTNQSVEVVSFPKTGTSNACWIFPCNGAKKFPYLNVEVVVLNTAKDGGLNVDFNVRRYKESDSLDSGGELYNTTLGFSPYNAQNTYTSVVFQMSLTGMMSYYDYFTLKMTRTAGGGDGYDDPLQILSVRFYEGIDFSE